MEEFAIKEKIRAILPNKPTIGADPKIIEFVRYSCSLITSKNKSFPDVEVIIAGKNFSSSGNREEPIRSATKIPIERSNKPL